MSICMDRAWITFDIYVISIEIYNEASFAKEYKNLDFLITPSDQIIMKADIFLLYSQLTPVGKGHIWGNHILPDNIDISLTLCNVN